MSDPAGRMSEMLVMVTSDGGATGAFAPCSVPVAVLSPVMLRRPRLLRLILASLPLVWYGV